MGSFWARTSLNNELSKQTQNKQSSRKTRGKLHARMHHVEYRSQIGAAIGWYKGYKIKVRRVSQSWIVNLISRSVIPYFSMIAKCHLKNFPSSVDLKPWWRRLVESRRSLCIKSNFDVQILAYAIYVIALFRKVKNTFSVVKIERKRSPIKMF